MMGALLAGCATTMVPPVSVTRFHDGAAAWQQPGVRVVLTAAPDNSDRLALRSYIAAVEQQLLRRGYVVVDGAEQPGEAPTLRVRVALDRSVTAQRRQGPVSIGVGGGTGGYRSGVGVGLGFNLGGGSRAIVNLRLSVRIDDAASGNAVWEGRAETSLPDQAPAAQGDLAAARLAEALFQDFPGQSGAVITVD